MWIKNSQEKKKNSQDTLEKKKVKVGELALSDTKTNYKIIIFKTV